MQLFYKQFPHFLENDFHIAAESYGGRYAPLFAEGIYNGNEKLKSDSTLKSKGVVEVPLRSVLLGNGLTDAYTQFATIPEFACEPSPYAIFSEQTCASIRSKIPTCQRLQKVSEFSLLFLTMWIRMV